MRHNSRPTILASTINASDLNVRPGETPSAVCPECGAWRIIRRGMIFARQMATGTARCPGSGQRIKLDIPLATLESREWGEVAQANQRRPTRIQLKASAPTVPPVFRLAAL